MTVKVKTVAAVAVGGAVLLAVGAFLVQQRVPEAAPLSSLPRPDGGAEVSGALPAGSGIPEIAGIASWLNTPGGRALTADDLRGKVVLIDFWTYSCINCIRTLPYLTAWYDKYADQGLVIIGVHTPEFAFEKDRGNVERALAKYGIRYPVPQDNDYATWNAFGNRYWPAKYLFDGEGRLVYTHFGEGEYEETEARIRGLLAAAGATVTAPMTEELGGPEFGRIGSPETYLGYGRGTRFGNTDIVPDRARIYFASMTPAPNRAYFGGTWTVGEESATAGAAGATLTYRFRARQVHLVMGAPEPVRMRVRHNGTLIAEDVVHDRDLYTLLTQTGYEEGVVEIEFLDPGVSVFAFTFG